jgi:hypothetical protein
MPPALSCRRSPQALEILGKPVLEADDLHQPGEIMFSGRTTASNSSLVT